MTAKLPVYDPVFWKTRIDNARQTNRLHQSVYAVGFDEWAKINLTHRVILSEILPAAGVTTVLDCGCGYGALIDLLPPGVAYTGVDLSPDFVKLAEESYRGVVFKVADLRDLPFPAGAFDLAVCRSVEGMVVTNVGSADWRVMQSEMLRVCCRLLLLNYSTPWKYHLLTEPNQAEPVID